MLHKHYVSITIVNALKIRKNLKLCKMHILTQPLCNCNIRTYICIKYTTQVISLDIYTKIFRSYTALNNNSCADKMYKIL